MKVMKKASVLIGIMLLTTLFMGLGFTPNVSAAEIHVPTEQTTIQDAINASSAGDIIIVDDGFYPLDLVVNKSVTIRSANGSAVTWINGTVNITVNDTLIGGSSTTGFTIYQETTTAGTNAVEIGTNGSRDNVSVMFCTIIGGFNGVQIGPPSEVTTYTHTDIDITANLIRDTGGSGIQSIYSLLSQSTIYANQISNTSNEAERAAIKLDGITSSTIISNIIHDTTTSGGDGILVTGLFHECNDTIIQENSIYDVDGFSPIRICSLADTEYVSNMRIIGNDLSNNSGTYAEPGIRFDNVSGLIDASNISVFFNNITSTSRAIEEQYVLSSIYSNWTGIMPAYFNWYGTDQGGTFRDGDHLYATPFLVSANAYQDILVYGTLELTGAASGYINNTINADVNVSGTSTDDLIVVAYHYPVELLATYPARSMHKYIEIGVSNYSRIDYPGNITVYYTEEDLEVRGWGERHIKGLVYLNLTTGKWNAFNDTGVSTTDLGWGDYIGFVWANVWEPLPGTIIGIDYKEIAPVTPAEPAEEAPPPTYEIPEPEELAFLGIALPWWILIIVLLAILIFFVVVMTNKKWRKKLFGY